MPKRITVLPSLPLTAIGKIYKPALRLQAAERVVRDRLDTAGLATRVTVQGVDRSGQLVLRFTASGDGRPESVQALEPALRTLMAGFVLTWEIT
jgi:fatty-acyl-CoA synthase